MKGILCFDDAIPMRQRDITFIYQGDHRYETASYFNPNAYPENLHPFLEGLSSRLAMCTHLTELIQKQVPKDLDKFREYLADEKNGVLAVPKDSKSFVFMLDGNELLSNFHAFLYAARSLLDILSILLSKSLGGPSLRFNKGKVDGKKIAGGRLINWLETNNKTRPARRMARDLKKHVNSWIDELVTYRDLLTHGVQKENLHYYSYAGSNANPSAEEITYPMLREGKRTDVYVESTLKNIEILLRDTLRHIPGIKTSLISMEELKIDHS